MPSNRPLRDIQVEINAWGNETFPNSTALSCALHLRKEAWELVESIESPNGSHEITDEIADVLMLAMQVAGKLGLDCEQLIYDKLLTNRGRDWEYDSALGYSVHVKSREDGL